MFKKISFTLLFSSGLFSLHAQQTIPFRITKHNNIIVKTLVNKKDSLDLMFQIAMEDAAISPERQRKADHIIFDKEEISENNTVQIGKLTLNNVRFSDHQMAGHEADGKIGTVLFGGKAFKIDYDNNQFIIYDQAPDVKDYQPITTLYDHEAYYLVADNVIDGDKQQEAYFVLQSGYSGGLLYSNDFAIEKNLDKKLKITGEKTLKNSSGQSIVTKQAILPFLKVGNNVLKDVSAGFFIGDLKKQTVNYFGADLLRRFNWVFDADKKTAYIKPSKYFSEPYYQIK
ncbi:hypothetical protein B0A69_06240 [Chryseobacterium shigense]|uniref:Aspartyl protease n=1 Tax=Chryseobacterium shigense TaxID=297244 RepID=A0A1N7I4I0_9FLAO|nr:hypothetical protein [Chryseobacterium shigense]PQA95048.1 hypothetical protein B0A69_06240 [Chryseobacterium shigense]SIS31993.1 hypothetical protein SAMN05421639_10216 [Chryseobacterium shigense]